MVKVNIRVIWRARTAYPYILGTSPLSTSSQVVTEELLEKLYKGEMISKMCG